MPCTDYPAQTHSASAPSCCAVVATHLPPQAQVVEEEEEVEEAPARPASPFAGLFGAKPAAQEKAPEPVKATPAPVSRGLTL